MGHLLGCGAGPHSPRRARTTSEQISEGRRRRRGPFVVPGPISPSTKPGVRISQKSHSRLPRLSHRSRVDYSNEEVTDGHREHAGLGPSLHSGRGRGRDRPQALGGRILLDRPAGSCHLKTAGAMPTRARWAGTKAIFAPEGLALALRCRAGMVPSAVPAVFNADR